MRGLFFGLLLSLMTVATADADELTGTLKRIDESGQINLGYRVAEPPMSFRQESGKVGGYSVELCERIAASVIEKLGRPDIAINYVPVTATNRFDAIEKGDIDILCGATTKTLGRAARVGFTQLTFVTGASLLGQKGTKLTPVSNLSGKRIAVVDGTTTIKALRAALEQNAVDAEVVPIGSATEGMDALDAGTVDAFSSDQVVLMGQVLMRADRTKEYSLSTQLFSFEPFALAIQRGDPDFKLVADTVLSRLSRNEEIMSIYQKWFGQFGQNPPSALVALYQLNAIPE